MSASRDRILLAAMGSPDQRQIDGVGGGDTLPARLRSLAGPNLAWEPTSPICSPRSRLTGAVVDTSPNCGNMLAAVAPFRHRAGLVAARVGDTSVMVYNVNTKTVAEVIVQTPGGRVTYKGNLQIAGVPGTAAPDQDRFPQRGRIEDRQASANRRGP